MEKHYQAISRKIITMLVAFALLVGTMAEPVLAAAVSGDSATYGVVISEEIEEESQEISVEEESSVKEESEEETSEEETTGEETSEEESSQAGGEENESQEESGPADEEESTTEEMEEESSVDPAAYQLTQEIVIDGDRYQVLVSYGEDAQIPETAHLEAKVVEVPAEEAAAMMGYSEEDIVYFTTVLDISILDGDEEIEPAEGAEVTVTVTLLTEEAIPELDVFHIVEDESGVTQDKMDSETDGDSVTFTTDHFSLFAFGAVAQEIVSWSDGTINNVIYGKSSQEEAEYTPVEVPDVERGLEVLEAYEVTSSADLWLSVERANGMELGALESVDFYSLDNGVLGEVVKENLAVEDTLRVSLSDLSGYAVLKDTGLRERTLLSEDERVQVAGLVPKDASLEAVPVESSLSLDEGKEAIASYEISILSAAVTEAVNTRKNAAGSAALRASENGSVSGAPAKANAISGNAVSDGTPTNSANQSQNTASGDNGNLATNDMTAGSSWQPSEPVEARIYCPEAADAIAEGFGIELWHVADAADPERVAYEMDGDYLVFEAQGFSEYTIVKVVLETTILASDGNTYRITASYDNTTGIPMEGTKLQVRELDPESGEYEAYYESAAGSLTAIDGAVIFDIKIVDKETGEEYQPAPGTTVDMSVVLMDINGRVSGGDVLHFGEDVEYAPDEEGYAYPTGEVLESVNQVVDDGYEYQFETDGFSAFIVAYTVDFYYNGYSHSILGGGSITLSEIFEDFHINVELSDVADVEFSDTTLVSVEKEGEDWRLTSLQPFDTEEKLTITLKDGSTIEIVVLDAQVTEEKANFKVINRSNGNASQQTVTYWENWGEAVNQANIASSAYPAKIEVLKDATITDTAVYSKAQTLTIEGNNHTVTRGTGVTGDLISMSSGTQALTISNLKIDGNVNVNATGALIKRTFNNTMALMKLENVTLYGGNTNGNLIQIDNSVSNRRAVQIELTGCTIDLKESTGSALSIHENTSNGTNSIKINNTVITGPTVDSMAILVNNLGNANLYIQNDVKIYRGDTKGSAISNTGSGTMTITDSTISGAKSATDSTSVSATSPLVKQGTGALTMTNATIEKHIASVAGVCAVDGSTASSISISGSTTIFGNIANEEPANLNVSEKTLTQAGTLTGDIGITGANNIDQENFATRSSNDLTGWEHYSADNNASLVAEQNGHRDIKWTWPTGGTGSGENEAREPRAAADFSGYPNRVSATKSHDVTVDIPLSKSLTINKNVNVLSQAEKNVLGALNFIFDIEEATTNPEDGAVITPKNGTGEEKGTSYVLNTSSLWNSGSSSGSKITWDLTDAWTITFKKPGTYSFEIKEQGAETGAGYTAFNDVTTLTYYVVEEEGILRVAEAYRGADATIEATKAGQKQNKISTGGLFYVSRKVNGNGKVAVSQSGNTISMELSQNGADSTFGAITTEFSFDFSRSFEISGTMQMVKEDGMSFAFQTNKRVSVQNQEGAYGLDSGSFGTGNAYTYQEKFLKEGSNASAANANNGKIVTASTLGKGFLFVMMNEPLSGLGSFLTDGLNRTPYSASSGLASGHYEILKLTNGNVAGGNIDNRSVYYNYSSNQPYSIRFDCSDHDTGLGTLTINTLGKTIVYNNFNASSIFGAGWREVYFVLGACEDNHATAMMSLTEFKYLDGIDSADVSYWADRNGDNVYETQVNAGNSPAVPGETILVRHKLVPTQESGYDHNFYIKTLVTQLKNITDEINLTGIDRTAVSWDGSNVALGVLDESTIAFNTYTLSNGMFVSVLQNKDATYFEYKIIAPSGFEKTVVESALFGEPPFPTIATETYGFRTEKKLEWATPSFTNTATIYTVTYNPAGGTFSDNTTANKDIPALRGTTFTVDEIPTKEGYAFAGWKMDENTIYEEGNTFTVSENVTLTAQWREALKVKIHLQELDEEGTLKDRNEWLTYNQPATIDVGGDITEAELIQAAKSKIKDDASFKIYSTDYLVKDNMSHFYVYGKSGGSAVDVTDKLVLNEAGTGMLIDGTKALDNNEVWLVLVKGIPVKVAKTDTGTSWDEVTAYRGLFWKEWFINNENIDKSLEVTFEGNSAKIPNFVSDYQQYKNYGNNGEFTDSATGKKYHYGYAILGDNASKIIVNIKRVKVSNTAFKWQYQLSEGTEWLDLGDNFITLRYNPEPVEVPVYWVYEKENGGRIIMQEIPAADRTHYGNSQTLKSKAEVKNTTPLSVIRQGSGIQAVGDSFWVVPQLGYAQTDDTANYPFPALKDDGTEDTGWRTKYEFSHFAIGAREIADADKLTNFEDTDAMYLRVSPEGIMFAKNSNFTDMQTAYDKALYIVYRTEPESDQICKITDSNDKLLYKSDGTAAVYKTLKDAFADISNGRLYTDNSKAESKKYSGTDMSVKMLVAQYDYKEDDSSKLLGNYNVTLTTAGKGDQDGYPFEGAEGGSCIIKRDGSAVNNKSMIQTTATSLTLTKLHIDGNGVEVTSDSSIISLKSGTLNVSADTVIENAKGVKGAAIHTGDSSTNYPATAININGAQFLNNEATGDAGGAIYANKNTTITITGATFSGNTAATAGGAIAMYGTKNGSNIAQVTISGSTFTGNEAKNGAGGAIRISEMSNVTLNSNNFTENKASGEGGAVAVLSAEENNSSTLTVKGGGFSKNVAGTNGGAIKIGGYGTLLLTDGVTLQENTAANNGGAIAAAAHTTVNMTSSASLVSNTATGGSGGGIYADKGSTITMDGPVDDNMRIYNCTAALAGGGIYLESDSTDRSALNLYKAAAVSKCKVTADNSNGGGVYLGSYASMTMNGTGATGTKTDSEEIQYTHIANSEAKGNGGGLYVAPGASVSITNNAEVSFNTAANGGGAYIASGTVPGTLTLNNAKITGNTASGIGGGIATDSGATLQFSGDAVVTENTANSANSNVCLAHDSNTIINSDGLGSSAHIGVYVTGSTTEESGIYYDHGGSFDAFGTYTGATSTTTGEGEGATTTYSDLYLHAFENDRNGLLGAARSDGKIVWLRIVPLTVTKTVTSGMGDLTKAFEFKASIAGNGQADTHTYTYWTGYESTVMGAGTNNADAFALRADETKTLYLPAETAVTIKEENANYYTTSFSGVTGVVVDKTTQNAENHQITLTIANDAERAAVTFTNNLEAVSPTGIDFRILPYLAMLLAGAALLLFVTTRRKKDQE